LHEALEQLLNLEKQTRMAADMKSTSHILVQMIKLCFRLNEWKLLNEYLVILSKRRGQLKQAIINMMHEAISYIDQTPNKETKLELIETLRMITEGKVII
jgi:26S proteasome regulatory subunit N5